MSITTTRAATAMVLSNGSSTEEGVPVLGGMLEFIEGLVAKGGPIPEEYGRLTEVLDSLAAFRKSEKFSCEIFDRVVQAFGASLTKQTIQGFAFLKPHGYAGDFEVIDKIYKMSLSSNPELQNWDRFVHSQSAFKAVKNRLSYFLEQVWRLKNSHPNGASVLNLASGPGRDMFESFRVIGKAPIHFDCVEQDAVAISHAKAVCYDYLDHLTFYHRNACRFMPEKRYDLIWSGGLFDYFNDKLFKKMIKRLVPALAQNGKLVIGNFSDRNPTQGYMEFIDWVLYHRSADALEQLAIDSGISPKNIWVEQEAEGVNLFLHIRNS